MKLSLIVKTGKKATKVTKIDATHYAVEVSARPIQGKANEAVISALAKHLDIPPSHFRIISGHTSKKKVVEY